MLGGKFVLIGCALAISTLAGAMQRFETARDPFTVVSPNGHTKLWVNPSDRNGRGKAFYRATKDGRLLWQVTLPYELPIIAITNGGVAGGCGVSRAVRTASSVVITEIDAGGKTHLLDTLIQGGLQPLDAEPAPIPRGVILDQDHDRFIVRTSDYEQKSIETWRIYSLTKASRTGIVSLGNFGFEPRRVLASAAYVKGTGAILLDWRTASSSGDDLGQSFSLVDAQMHEIWHEDHPQDFNLSKSIEKNYEAINELPEQGCILDTSKPERFVVRLVRKNVRVSYRFDGRVHEVSRTTYIPPSNGIPKMPVVPSVSLHTSRSFTIPRFGATNSPVHDIGRFFVDSNRIVLLRTGAHPSISMLSMDGRELSSIPLPAQPAGSDLLMTRTNGSKFVLISTDTEEAGHARAWSVDVDKRSINGLKSFSSFHVKAVAGFSGGGFALISSEHVPFSEDDHLSIYASDGRQIFDKRQAGYSGQPDDLLSPEDLTVDSKGNILILDVIRHTLQRFDPSGSFLNLVELDRKWDKKPEYPTGVCSLSDGTAWVYDFGRPNPLVHVSKDGAILRAIKPEVSPSQALEIQDHLGVQPDGPKLWVSDGNSIYRVGSSGMVDKVIGKKPQSKGLDYVGDVSVGPDGKVFAQDRDSGVVYVFRPGERKLYSFALTPPKAPKGFREFAFSLLPSGDVSVSGGYANIYYSPSGAKLSASKAGSARQPEIDRLPDQSWFTGDILTAPDGRLAAMDVPEPYSRRTDLPAKIGFYTKKGAPLSQIVLPLEIDGKGSAVFDGQRVFIATKKGILAIDRSGRFLWRFRPKNWNGREQLFFSRGKIAVFDGDRAVTWYDLPSGHR